jgi:transcriptional regulator with XRE-family HTH domain
MDQGLTQAALAARIGVDAASIRNWELNKRRPHPRHLAALSKYLGYFPAAIGDDLPNRIRAARQSLGMSQGDLAQRLGVSDSTVRKWEHGMKRPYARFTRLFQQLIADAGLTEGTHSRVSTAR